MKKRVLAFLMSLCLVSCVAYTPESSEEFRPSPSAIAGRAHRLHLLDQRLHRAEKVQRSLGEKAIALTFYSIRERQALEHLLRIFGVKKGLSLVQQASESQSATSADERLAMMEDHMSLIEKQIAQENEQFETNKKRIKGIIATMKEKFTETHQQKVSDIEHGEMMESLLMQGMQRMKEQQEAIAHFDTQQYAFEEELAKEFQRLLSLFKLFESAPFQKNH